MPVLPVEYEKSRIDYRPCERVYRSKLCMDGAAEILEPRPDYCPGVGSLDPRQCSVKNTCRMVFSCHYIHQLGRNDRGEIDDPNKEL